MDIHFACKQAFLIHGIYESSLFQTTLEDPCESKSNRNLFVDEFQSKIPPSIGTGPSIIECASFWLGLVLIQRQRLLVSIATLR